MAFNDAFNSWFDTFWSVAAVFSFAVTTNCFFNENKPLFGTLWLVFAVFFAIMSVRFVQAQDELDENDDDEIGDMLDEQPILEPTH